MYEMVQSKRNPDLWLVYNEYGEWVMTGDWETCAGCVDMHNAEYDSNLDWRGYAEEAPDGYDDSDWEYEKNEHRGCSDCPDDECTGHCMSCYYRPV